MRDALGVSRGSTAEGAVESGRFRVPTATPPALCDAFIRILPYFHTGHLLPRFCRLTSLSGLLIFLPLLANSYLFFKARLQADIFKDSSQLRLLWEAPGFHWAATIAACSDLSGLPY